MTGRSLLVVPGPETEEELLPWPLTTLPPDVIASADEEDVEEDDDDDEQKDGNALDHGVTDCIDTLQALPHL